MLKLEVGRLLELHERLTVARGNFARWEHELTKAGTGHIEFAADNYRKLLNDVTDVERISKLAGLMNTQKAAERTKGFLSKAPVNDPTFKGSGMVAGDCATMSGHLMDIVSRIRDECNSRLYFQIAPENAELLRPDVQHFGADVEEAFSAATEDIAEAASCLGLERTTACVFHLMRAMEAAVRRLGEKLNVTIIDRDNVDLEWGKILANMKAPIEAMPRGETKNKWSECLSFLYHVKQAWRNDTMHPKKTYTAVEARRAYQATQSFMQHLATL
jgi:hypothetical protein